MAAIKQADRVSFALGRKVTDGNYGSYDVHVSYTSDVEPNETPEEAVGRCVEVVTGLVEAQLEAVVARL